MIQVGMLGLMNALRDFDPGRGFVFLTYANHRIEGAMLDELRRTDDVSRIVRKKSRDAREAVRGLEQTLFRAPSAGEVAVSLGVSTQDYFETLGASARVVVEAQQDDGETGAEEESAPELDPYHLLQERQQIEALLAAVEELPPRLKRVVSEYHEHEKTMGEIAQGLQVSESRVSLLHRDAIRLLRLRLWEHR